MRADACEMASLELVGLEHCQVVVAATGDDKVNLVVSCCQRPSTASRAWSPGSTTPRTSGCSIRCGGSMSRCRRPRLLSALVEEAVAVGDLVRLMTFRQSRTNLVEMTLPHDSNVIGRAVGDVEWPVDTSWWLSCARTGSSHPHRTTRWRWATSCSSSPSPSRNRRSPASCTEPAE